MDDAERAEMIKRLSSQNSRSTPTLLFKRTRGVVKQQEPVCPVDIKGPELADRINDWLTYVRHDMEEKLRTAEETKKGHIQSNGDPDVVLVCVYDHKQEISKNNRSDISYRSGNQPMSKVNGMGTRYTDQRDSEYQWKGNGSETGKGLVLRTGPVEYESSQRQANAWARQLNTEFKRLSKDSQTQNQSFNQTNIHCKPPTDRHQSLELNNTTTTNNNSINHTNISNI
ncbi:uncharacterized protein [Argopecten irradians]|uniref:uncharacterized protein n=1 Tax=Argopecten irradians TaxID=31199 RepID=UPI0037109251